MLMEFTDANFNEVVNGTEKPVLIDFWAEWCGPCRAMSPIVKELSEEYGEKVIVGKMDVDANTTIPNQFGIRSIPTILFFKGGEQVDRLVGAVPKIIVASKLDSLL